MKKLVCRIYFFVYKLGSVIVEEIAATNLAKFRKTQTELGMKLKQTNFFLLYFSIILEESAERADQAENQLGKIRAKSRSSVSVSRLSPGVSRFSYRIIFI